MRKCLPKWLTSHLYFRGDFHLKIKPNYIITLESHGYQLENEMFWYGIEGYHESMSHRIVNEFIAAMNPKHFFDVGANTGTYGIIAKKLNPELSVFFFAFQKKALEILSHNLLKNDMVAEIVPCALSNFDGEAEIFVPKGSEFVYSVSVNECHLESGVESETSTIKVSRFDTIFSNRTFEDVAVFKLDVEYHEIQVLEGIGNSFFEQVKLQSGWLIEVLNEDIGSRLENYFPANRFHYFNIDDRRRKVKLTQRIIKGDQYNYFIVAKEVSQGVPILREVLEQTAGY